MCIESPDAVSSLALGQVIAANECEYQFKGEIRAEFIDLRSLFILSFSTPGHRWNCSQVWKKDSLGHIMIVGELN